MVDFAQFAGMSWSENLTVLPPWLRWIHASLSIIRRRNSSRTKTELHPAFAATRAGVACGQYKCTCGGHFEGKVSANHTTICAMLFSFSNKAVGQFYVAK